MARISLHPPRSLLYRIGAWYGRRITGGAGMDPLKAVAHNKRVLFDFLLFEQRVSGWTTLDPALQHLALMVSAARIECSWCVDFGYWLAEDLGMSEAKVRAVASWRTSPEPFTRAELLVMEYAEAMTATPPEVTDELSAKCRDLLGEAGLVELTAVVAVENLRSRSNNAFGITGQGFSTNYAVPAK